MLELEIEIETGNFNLKTAHNLMKLYVKALTHFSLANNDYELYFQLKIKRLLLNEQYNTLLNS